MSVSATVTGENINLNSTDVITLLAGSSINVATSQINMNNTKISGLIDLDNLALTGTSKMQLQTSIFNELQENLVNSVNSQSRADQYGAVYGPTYGDNLGIFNGLGAFNGTSVGGYIGKSYCEFLNNETYGKLQMYPLANNPFKETNAQIPMNIYANTISLSDFTTYSYNLSSSTNGAIVYDSFFGNLFPLTANGKDGSKNIYNRIDGNLNLQFTTVNGNFNIFGNLILSNINKEFVIVNGNAVNALGNPQVLQNPNTIDISANILAEPSLGFRASLNRTGSSISGITSVFNGNVYSNLNLSGTVINGNFYAGNIQCLYNKFDFFANDFYRYAWHGNSNLKYLPQLEFPTGNISYPFGNIKGNNILIAGELTPYNGGTYLPTVPLFPNQIAMFYYYYTPNPFTKEPFNIAFNYQLYSQLRGDYFYFQYSIDGAKTWNNLLVQSGDIQSVKSQAIYNPSQWKPTSFFMPYSQYYIFRWVYKKSLNQENGYDTVIISDLSITDIKHIVDIDETDPFNTQRITYSDKYLGDVVAGTITANLIADYNLTFWSGNFASNSLVVNGMTSMNNYNWGDKRNSNPFYGNLNNFSKQFLLPLNNKNYYLQPSHFSYNVVTNASTDDVKNRGWRFYNIEQLNPSLFYPYSGNGAITEYLYAKCLKNATKSFLDGKEQCLMTSLSNKINSYGTNGYANDTIGLQNFDSNYFVIGPLSSTDSNFGLLLSNNHFLKFKYIVDGLDHLGLATYDYKRSDDINVLNTLVKLLSLSFTYENPNDPSVNRFQLTSLLNGFYNYYTGSPISTASTALVSFHIKDLSALSNGASVTNWNGYTGTNATYYNSSINLNQGNYYNPMAYVTLNTNSKLIATNKNVNCQTNGGFTFMIMMFPSVTPYYSTLLFCKNPSSPELFNEIRIARAGSNNISLYMHEGLNGSVIEQAVNIIDTTKFAVYTVRVVNTTNVKTYEFIRNDQIKSPWSKGTFTITITNKTNADISLGFGDVAFVAEIYKMGSAYFFDYALSDSEIESMVNWMYIGNTIPQQYGPIEYDKIKYHPIYSPYQGIYKGGGFPFSISYYFSQWNDVSFEMKPIPLGYKRIYVIYGMKDNANNSWGCDVALIHDLKFSFYNQINTILDKNGNFYLADGTKFITNDGYLRHCITNFTEKSILDDTEDKNVAGIIPLNLSNIDPNFGPTTSYNWTIRGVYQYADGAYFNGKGGDFDLIKAEDGNAIIGTRAPGTRTPYSYSLKVVLGKVDDYKNIDSVVIASNDNQSTNPATYSFYSKGKIYAQNGYYNGNYLIGNVQNANNIIIGTKITNNNDPTRIVLGNVINPENYSSCVIVTANNNSGTPFQNSLYTLGNIFVNGIVTAQAFPTSSDRRIKENIQELKAEDAIEIINNIIPKSFNFKEGDKQKEYGFIAQELEPIFHAAVSNSSGCIPNLYIDGCIQILDDMKILKSKDKMDLIDKNRIRIQSGGNNYDVDIISILDPYTVEIRSHLPIGDYFIYGQYVTDYKSVDKTTLIPIIVSAMREMNKKQIYFQTRIAELETVNTDLNNKVLISEDKINELTRKLDLVTEKLDRLLNQ